MIKIVIADDHPIVRNGVKTVLSLEENFEIIAEAADGEDAFEKIYNLNPQVAVVDMSMPKLNGLGLLEKIKQAKLCVNVIVLSNYDDEDYILGSIKAGAKAYLLKDIDLDALIQTINAVKDGEPFYSQRVAKILANQFTNEDKKEKLTTAELNVLKEIAKGNSSKMIADILNVSTRTVETHRYRILKKLGAQNSADLIRIAIEQKIV